MTINNIDTVVIIGAGTMGQGIAQVTAMAGYNTLIYDISEEAVNKGLEKIKQNLQKGIDKRKVTEQQKTETLERIVPVKDFNRLKGDIIIEAVLENLDIKKELFQKLEELNTPETIFASNTSSIPITQIGVFLKYPERLVGFHFFNPAHIMKLVEIISGTSSDPDIAQKVKDFAGKLGKVAVMAKDSPGFIVNRVARHFYVESLKVVEDGVTGFETVDKLLEASGFKMGPFRLMDLIGIDTNFSVTESMYNSFYQDKKFRPSRLQKQKIDAGYLGRKSGRGFYRY